MGYKIKVQKVERPTNRSYYVNLPVVLAETLGVKKGEQWQWSVKNQNTLVFSRVRMKTKQAGRGK
jgi:antitoxin component of MazEF toxin-antitoxin module